jgi:hypothetical protein
MLDLARVGLVGGDELLRPGVGILEIDIDQRRFAAKAEAPAAVVRLDDLVELARGSMTQGY